MIFTFLSSQEKNSILWHVESYEIKISVSTKFDENTATVICLQLSKSAFVIRRQSWVVRTRTVSGSLYCYSVHKSRWHMWQWQQIRCQAYCHFSILNYQWGALTSKQEQSRLWGHVFPFFVISILSSSVSFWRAFIFPPFFWHSMWGLGSLPRDQTHGLCSGSTDS